MRRQCFWQGVQPTPQYAKLQGQFGVQHHRYGVLHPIDGGIPGEIAAAAPATEGLFEVLGDILQQAMESQADNGEILPLLLAFSEARSHPGRPQRITLKPGSLQAEASRTGGPEVSGGRRAWLEICALGRTHSGQLTPAMPALVGSLDGKSGALCHGTPSGIPGAAAQNWMCKDENILLAAADLLVLPSVAEDERDSLEKQKCRVAALKLFSRCCATASLDFVLQLRAEEGMDTVLQSLVLLCHHELLCLLMYGNPWRNEDLEESRKQRLQAVETSLFLLASLAWQLSPLKDGLETEKWTIEGRVPRDAQFGRTQVLLPSIVDMVSENESEEDFQPFLSSISAVRLLLEEPATSSSASGSYPAVVT
eukprot:s1518_g16.t2